MSTPGMHALGVPPPDVLPDPPLPEPEPPPPGSGGTGRPPGDGGGAGGCGGWGAPAGGCGAGTQGITLRSATVTPCSLTWTGWPLSVTWPPVMCASPLPPDRLLVALTSTVTFWTCTLPIDQFCTSECVVTVRFPPWSIWVRVVPCAPLNGWAWLAPPW